MVILQHLEDMSTAIKQLAHRQAEVQQAHVQQQQQPSPGSSISRDELRQELQLHSDSIERLVANSLAGRREEIMDAQDGGVQPSRTHQCSDGLHVLSELFEIP